jgi:CRP-like cAMP-binding protein
MRAVATRRDTVDARIALLGSLERFPSLDRRRLAELAAALVRVSFPAGAVIACEGEERDYFYVVVEGRIEVARRGRQAEVLGPGHCIGEQALLHGAHDDAGIVALEPTIVYAVDAEAFGAALSSERRPDGASVRGSGS